MGISYRAGLGRNSSQRGLVNGAVAGFSAQTSFAFWPLLWSAIARTRRCAGPRNIVVSHRSYIITIKCCHRNAANEFQIFICCLCCFCKPFSVTVPHVIANFFLHTHPFGFDLAGLQSISHLVTATLHLRSQTKHRIDDDNNDVLLLAAPSHYSALSSCPGPIMHPLHVAWCAAATYEFWARLEGISRQGGSACFQRVFGLLLPLHGNFVTS